MLEHAESRLVFCEDAEQAAKVAQVRDDCPDARACVTFDGSRRRRPLAGRAARAWAPASTPRPWTTSRGRAPGGPGHDRLHVRDDRPAEGLRHHARQLHGHGPDVRGRARVREQRGARRGVHVPAAGALAGARDPDGGAGRGRDDRVLARRPCRGPRGPGEHSAHACPLRAARVREGAHQGAERASRRPGGSKRDIFHWALRTGSRVREPRARGPHGRAAAACPARARRQARAVEGSRPVRPRHQARA